MNPPVPMELDLSETASAELPATAVALAPTPQKESRASPAKEQNEGLLEGLADGVETVGDVLPLARSTPSPASVAMGTDLVAEGAAASGGVGLVDTLGEGLGAAVDGTGQVMATMAEGAGDLLGALGEGAGHLAEAVGEGLGAVLESLGDLFSGW